MYVRVCMYQTIFTIVSMLMCTDKPFCMSASMVYVFSAPANLSEGDFSPFTVGIASISYSKYNPYRFMFNTS